MPTRTLESDFERRKSGADATADEIWPSRVEPHKFVRWPNHVACAWCCGAVSNGKWHTK